MVGIKKVSAKRAAVRKLVAPPAAPARRRAVLNDGAIPPPGSYSYFADAAQKDGLSFVSSGCTVMDAALGGGYVLGRVANIVGDRSSGKTLCAMEVCANFALAYERGWIRYAESEAAFDQAYAVALGMPVNRIEFNRNAHPMDTVEALYDDLVRCLDAHQKQPGVYILDSLDALSDDAEQERTFDKDTFGASKPKQISKMFRMLIDRIEAQQVLLLVVSQIRDKIGVTFGETKTRSGGKALDFYASHIVWLAEIEKLKATREKIERVTGVRVRARVRKNKVGLPFREAEYPILFGYGIDDLTANVEWLLGAGREKLLRERFAMSREGYKVRLGNLRNKGGQEVAELRAALTKTVFEEWAKIETMFLPQSRKY